MPDRRTYGDDEVAEIFSLAAELEGTTAGASARGADRLTLPQLQEVGREAGLSPEKIAEAAALVDARPDSLARGRSLVAPVEVTRTVDLPRELTEREWEILAAELRETFGTPGRMISRGSTHEWTDGEIHALVEPTASGHRVRLGARTGPVTAMAVAGGFGLLVGVLQLVANWLDEVTFGVLVELVLPVVLVLVGGAAVGLHIRRLGQWTDDRERRLERIAERARELTGSPVDES